MKKFFLLNLICVFYLVSVSAQITYTSNSFPQAGDIIQTTTAVDSLLNVTPASASPSTWDFSGLIPINTNYDTIKAASSGAAFASFPSADILQSFIGSFGGTAYVDVTSNQVIRIGGGVEVFGLSFISPFIDPHVTQQVPLTYPDIHTDSYQWANASHIDSVPFLGPLIDSFTGGLIDFDSIRFALEGDETRSVDAYGTCVMTHATHNVLRQKIISDFEFKIELYIPPPFGLPVGGTWFDATSFIAGSLPFPTSGTVVRYDFLSEGIKQPLVSLTMDSTETFVTNIEFLLDTTGTIGIDYILDEIDVNIFPNPVEKVININIGSDIPFGGYNLYLTDILGRVAIVKKHILDQNQQLDISNIPNGTYVLILRDRYGKILKREKLEILK